MEQEVENAIQCYNTQFGLDFSNAEPNKLGQRFVGNARFQFNLYPGTFIAVSNNWIVNGNRRSSASILVGVAFKCISMVI